MICLLPLISLYKKLNLCNFSSSLMPNQTVVNMYERQDLGKGLSIQPLQLELKSL